MKILVTGARGFVGKNLIAELKNHEYNEIFEFTRESTLKDLDYYTKECDFVFHLAGVNRPRDEKEFMEGNFGLTSYLLDMLKKHKNRAPILVTSSIQADQDNAYGRSKKAAEDLLLDYQIDTCAEVYIYRLPNLFGKWSKPNYNSVVATFCYNVANDLELQINNPEAKLTLCYIDDVLDEFLNVLEGNPTVEDCEYVVPVTHTATLGEIADLIKSFKESRSDLSTPYMECALTKKLYSTYLSFLPEDQFAYDLKMNTDHRGSFTEFLRTSDRGQVSVNVSMPGITKGEHWHHTKNEKFLVVSGEGVIRLRKLDSDRVIEYKVNGDKFQVIDIPPGYTHSIVNVGEREMVTVMWVNESFNSKKPDTYYMEV